MAACELDHIVVAASTLAEGIGLIRERLGVEIPPGGRHLSMGTHNHLMRLGADCYLEVIAVDPEAAPLPRPRWFDLDNPAMQARLRAGPSLVSWVVRTADVMGVAENAAVPLGRVLPVSRGALSWRLTVPDDGCLVGGGVIPSVIQWDDGLKPWETIADLGCRLVELTLTHPDPAWVETALRSLCDAGFPFVKIAKGDSERLMATIRTASGERVEI